MQIGTWNIGTLNEVGKLENLKNEMKILNLYVKRVSDFWTGDYRMLNTVGKGGHAGVAIIMNKTLENRVQSYIRPSERILLGRISLN